jgi:hypothetical protein
LYSGFNTFFKRPEGRGIKPLNTNKIFTADKNIILSVAGHLAEDRVRTVIDAIITIISS